MKNKKVRVLEISCYKNLLLAFLLLFSFEYVKAEELKSFLRSCGYGTLAGAGVGLASLVFEKKPNESYSNIARGASLGLYMGIGYGFVLLNQNKQTTSESLTWNGKPVNFAVLPSYDGGIQALLSFDFSL
jgi:hypothetical protein